MDLVRNVRSSKKPASSSYSQQRGARPTSWQAPSNDPYAAPPVYEGFQGGSLAGGSVVDAGTFMEWDVFG